MQCIVCSLRIFIQVLPTGTMLIAKLKIAVWHCLGEKLCAFYDYVGSLHLPIISACKSVIVSPYTPAL